MPRPTNKTDLLKAADAQFEKMWKLIDSMSTEEHTATFKFEDRDKNLRDILVHLYEWHQMVKRWHLIGTIEGGIPDVPGKGYSWKTLPDLNLEIWKKYQDVTLEDSKKMLVESHKMNVALVESHTNEELFDKGFYKWTKSTNLGAYFVSSMPSHYEWAMTKIKKHLKTYRA